MDNKTLIEKLQSALGASGSKQIKKVVVFSENKQAAKEYVFNLHSFSENYGTFRIVNKGARVCYDIVGMDEKLNFAYDKSFYFDGTYLVALEEILSKAEEVETMPVYEEDFTDVVEETVEKKIEKAKKGRRNASVE